MRIQIEKTPTNKQGVQELIRKRRYDQFVAENRSEYPSPAELEKKANEYADSEVKRLYPESFGEITQTPTRTSITVRQEINLPELTVEEKRRLEDLLCHEFQTKNAKGYDLKNQRDKEKYIAGLQAYLSEELPKREITMRGLKTQ